MGQLIQAEPTNLPTTIDPRFLQRWPLMFRGCSWARVTDLVFYGSRPVISFPCWSCGAQNKHDTLTVTVMTTVGERTIRVRVCDGCMAAMEASFIDCGRHETVFTHRLRLLIRRAILGSCHLPHQRKELGTGGCEWCFQTSHIVACKLDDDEAGRGGKFAVCHKCLRRLPELRAAVEARAAALMSRRASLVSCMVPWLTPIGLPADVCGEITRLLAALVDVNEVLPDSPEVLGR